MIAAIYARKSTEQTNAQSVTRQVENARVFADAHGWTVDERFIFIDDGVSGAETPKARRDKAGVNIYFYADGTKFDAANTLSANVTGFLKAEFAAESRRAITRKMSEAMC